MEKVLITGANGFIALNYLSEFIDDDVLYVGIDNFSLKKDQSTLKKLMKYDNFKFFKMSINSKKVEELFKKYNFDYVINFAAESHVDNSLIDIDKTYKTNLMGTINLLELALKYKVKRFIQISTDEVYGDVKLDEEFSGYKENDLLKPSSPYSASKAAADLAVLSFVRSFSLDAIITRSSNNYGKFQHQEKLIPKIIFNAINDKKIPIYNKGKEKRDWLYVLDNVFYIHELIKKGEKGEIYNLSSHHELANIDLTYYILNKLNKPASLIEFSADRLGHDRRYKIDTSKVENLITHQNHDFYLTLDETIKYYANFFKKP